MCVDLLPGAAAFLPTLYGKLSCIKTQLCKVNEKTTTVDVCIRFWEETAQLEP